MAKENVKLAIIGHVDHGKSTLIGRILLDTKSIPAEKLAEIRKISRNLDKESELAYFTDQLKEEREKDITIDTAQIFFSTKKSNYCIVDTPGHVEFIKNMITGASLVKLGILIVDANEGIMEQTRRHAYLAGMLGFDRLIVVVNKMDLAEYRHADFSKIHSGLSEFLKTIHIKPDYFIPISARKGDNVLRKSGKMPWYKGPVLLEAMDTMKVSVDSNQKPFRFPVQDIYSINGQNIVVGRVASGTIRTKHDVVILPDSKKTTVTGIVTFGKPRKKAGEGENIGLLLDDTSGIRRGDVIACEGSLPRLTDRFAGRVFWMSEEPLRTGSTVLSRCATQQVNCVAEKIENRMNSSTLQIIEEDAAQLNINEAARVVLRPDSPIIVEDASYIDELGKFIIEKNHVIQGMGTIST